MATMLCPASGFRIGWVASFRLRPGGHAATAGSGCRPATQRSYHSPVVASTAGETTATCYRFAMPTDEQTIDLTVSGPDERETVAAGLAAVLAVTRPAGDRPAADAGSVATAIRG